MSVNEIHLAATAEQVRDCFVVLQQLRSPLTPGAFSERVIRQWSDG